MAKDISTIKEEIYGFAKDYEIFKNNSYINACFKLTCAAEYRFLDVMAIGMQSFGKIPVSVFQDKIRGAYREALKYAYKYCDRPKDDTLEFNIENSELKKTIDELMSFSDFNQVRNLFEQTQLGRYSVSVNLDKEITFERNKSKRAVDAELYARWIDSRKLELIDRQMNKGIEEKLYSYMAGPNNNVYWDFADKSFSKLRHLKDVYKLALEKVNIDTEELDNYDLDNFTTDEFKMVYASLIAISVTNINYHFVPRMLKRFEMDINKPIVVFELNKLVDLISNLTRLKDETILAVVQKLNYQAEFHKDKISIFQPLFIARDTVFFSPSLIYWGLAYSKLLYLLKSDEKYNTLIPKIAKEREDIMTNDLCEFLDNNCPLLYIPNYTVKEGKDAKAEFDLILYDENSRKMLLCELKWFFTGDGEYDMSKIDRKIKDAINNRLKKEEIAKSHLEEIKEALELDEDGDIEIKSCIISKNYSGSDFLEDKLPVFDMYWFKSFIEQNNFDLAKCFKAFDDNNYLPDMSSVKFSFVPSTVEVAGYKIHFEGLGQSK
ncbi:MAG: hypothetical protein K2M75_01895 [Clostridia bacterium]|nr:hypothetical protein [Clostridia bacterium]